MYYDRNVRRFNQSSKEAHQNAYAPYSKFPVGAALKLRDGNIINGANVENASFGLTNCAERSALFAAFTKGYRREDIEAIAVVANTDRPISPCGACRQVISELMPADAPVILLSNKDEIKVYRVLNYYLIHLKRRTYNDE